MIKQVLRRILGTNFRPLETAENVISSQVLTQDQSKLGEEVYAVYLYAVPYFKKWWDYLDKCESYYRGEARPKSRGKNRTNANQNIVFSDIETVKPTVRSSLVNPTLYAENKEGFDAARKLNLRTENIWKDSGVRDSIQEKTIHDVLVGGTSYFKTLYDKDAGKKGDVRVIRPDSRRILFDLAVKDEFHKSRWIMDVTETTPAAVENEFKKRVQQAGAVELESDENRPSGPTPAGGALSNVSSANFSIASQGGEVIVYGSGSNATEKWYSDHVEKAIKIEMWIWDLTRDENGKKKYPHGRRITVAVGLTKKGKVTDKTRPETIVLEDISNPCKRLAEQMHEFPFAQVQCHNVGEIMGVSEVSGRGDIQDLINDAINQLHDNWRLNNCPTRYVHKRYGLTEKNVVNQPDGVVVIDAPIEDVRRAIHIDRPTPIAGDAISVISLYMKLNEQGGGAADVVAGRQPGGVQSGVGIAQLQSRAQGRFQTISKNVNDFYKKEYSHVALLAQDFDDKYSGKMQLINESADHDKPDELYADYDPYETKDVQFRTEISKKLSPEEVQAYLQAAAQLEAGGIDGEILLGYIEERGLLLQWRELKKRAAEQEQNQKKTEMDATAAKNRQDAAKRLSVKALDIIQQENNNGKQEKKDGSQTPAQTGKPGSGSGKNRPGNQSNKA